MKGGKCVTVLNTGTNNKPATPVANTKFRSNGVVGSHSSSCSAWGRSTSPFNRKLNTANGTTMLTILGTIKCDTMTPVPSCPPIHSMVVVTSPIGDHAPPELAEMTTIPANNQRVGRSAINLRNKETITMDVVKLSNKAEKKNVRRIYAIAR